MKWVMFVLGLQESYTGIAVSDSIKGQEDVPGRGTTISRKGVIVRNFLDAVGITLH